MSHHNDSSPTTFLPSPSTLRGDPSQPPSPSPEPLDAEVLSVFADAQSTLHSTQIAILEELPEWIHHLKALQDDSEAVSYVPDTKSDGEKNKLVGTGYEPWDLSEEVSSLEDVIESVGLWKRMTENEKEIETGMILCWGKASTPRAHDTLANVNVVCTEIGTEERLEGDEEERQLSSESERPSNNSDGEGSTTF